jgi:RNA polymerase sigma-70 factor (ECF subfamily)
MRRVAARDPNALRALYDRHAALVFALCLRILRDRADAEDLLVDVFWELWDKSARFDPGRGSPVSYLVLLARSRAIDRKRGKRKLATGPLISEDLPATADVDPAAGANLAERAELVKQALSQLEPQQRQAIECSFYDGLSHSEIADKLSKPLGTIKTYIRQGLIRMREMLRTENDRTLISGT